MAGSSHVGLGVTFMGLDLKDVAFQDESLLVKIPELVSKLSQMETIDEKRFWRECYPHLCKMAAEFNRKHSR